MRMGRKGGLSVCALACWDPGHWGPGLKEIRKCEWIDGTSDFMRIAIPIGRGVPQDRHSLGTTACRSVRERAVHRSWVEPLKEYEGPGWDTHFCVHLY